MSPSQTSILTDGQLADYEELGFIHSIPILSGEEVQYYRGQLEETRHAIGGRSERLNGLHRFFRWAWDLSTHPRLLDCMEQLLGPNILLKSTRLFYKRERSASFVGWHQDGITERVEDSRVPAIWLGLTAATVENGCLRVVPRSHRLGLIPHASRPDNRNLTTQGMTAVSQIDSPTDLVMRPGEMSLHHPLILHASTPNLSAEPRIGFTATYSTPALPSSLTPIAWVRGDGPRDRFEMIDAPRRDCPDEALAAYRDYDRKLRLAYSLPEQDSNSDVWEPDSTR